MAAKKAPGADAGYVRLREDLKSGSPTRLYIFHGVESYLKRYYAGELQKALVPAGFEEFNAHLLEGKGLTVQALTEAVEALPLMGERTFVRVTDLDLFKLPEDQRTRLIALVEDVPEYCCLVFLYDQLEYKPNKTYKKLCAALDRHAQVVNFQEQSQGELMKWISRRLKAVGHTIDAPTAEYLLFTCGSLMAGLIPEIEKVGAYAKGGPVTREDIDAVVTPLTETRVFDMTGALSRGEFDKAAAVLGTLLDLREEPIPLLALMGKELRRLYTARLALDTGRDRYWLMELWHMRSDYPARILMENAGHVRTGWCRKALRRCYQADLRMKSVTGVDGEEELRLLLAVLAQEAKAS